MVKAGNRHLTLAVRFAYFVDELRRVQEDLAVPWNSLTGVPADALKNSCLSPSSWRDGIMIDSRTEQRRREKSVLMHSIGSLPLPRQPGELSLQQDYEQRRKRQIGKRADMKVLACPYEKVDEATKNSRQAKDGERPDQQQSTVSRDVGNLALPGALAQI